MSSEERGRRLEGAGRRQLRPDDVLSVRSRRAPRKCRKKSVCRIVLHVACVCRAPLDGRTAVFGRTLRGSCTRMRAERWPERLRQIVAEPQHNNGTCAPGNRASFLPDLRSYEARACVVPAFQPAADALRTIQRPSGVVDFFGADERARMSNAARRTAPPLICLGSQRVSRKICLLTAEEETPPPVNGRVRRSWVSVPLFGR